MKYFVLEKTKYIFTNSWLGLLLPVGVHQLFSTPEKRSVSDKSPNTFSAHPAEFRITRTPASQARP